MPVSAAISRISRRENVRRHGCAARQGRCPPLSEGDSDLLESLGVHVPHVHEATWREGCCCSRTSAAHSTSPAAQCRGRSRSALYGDALQALADIQVRGAEAARRACAYDREVLARELALMPEWFSQRHLATGAVGREKQIDRGRVRVPDRARRSRSRWCSCIGTIIRAT